MTAAALPMDDQVSIPGRYAVGRHWHRWAVLDQSWNPPHTVSTHNTQAEAAAAADRLNQPPQRTRQTTLFDIQEVTSA
jgi:hypothetical protein